MLVPLAAHQFLNDIVNKRILDVSSVVPPTGRDALHGQAQTAEHRNADQNKIRAKCCWSDDSCKHSGKSLAEHVDMVATYTYAQSDGYTFQYQISQLSSDHESVLISL